MKSHPFICVKARPDAWRYGMEGPPGHVVTRTGRTRGKRASFYQYQCECGFLGWTTQASVKRRPIMQPTLQEKKVKSMTGLIGAIREANGGKSDANAEGLALAAEHGLGTVRWNRLMKRNWSTWKVGETEEALRGSGLINEDGSVECDGWEDDVSFWLDVLVVEGLVERVTEAGSQ